MDFPDDLDGEMKTVSRSGAHASFFIVSAYSFMVSWITPEIFSLETLGRSGVRIMDPPVWKETAISSPTFKCANSIIAESKMIPWEFPTLVIVFVI